MYLSEMILTSKQDIKGDEMSDRQDDLVTSVWGRISRREMLRRLAASGLAVGLGGGLFDQLSAQTKTVVADGATRSPYLGINGQAFRPFEMPRVKGVAESIVKSSTRGDARDGRPPIRRRDSFWYSKPNNALGANIYQYTQSASYPSNSCAQAACATLLHKHGKLPPGLSGDAVTDLIYSTHPPEGASGTTMTLLVEMIRAYGLNAWRGNAAEYGYEVIRSALRTWVAAGYPCVVLLDMRYPLRRPETAYYGHYVVVFAYDENETNGYVYLSNWDYKSWANDWTTFKKAWSLPDYPAHAYPLIAGWRG